MKKILYHYTCLALSLGQAFLWSVFFWLVFGYGSMMLAPMIIIAVIELLITVILDRLLRKMSDAVPMIIFSYLFSPIRFIGEIVTIVRMHVKGLDSDFAKRGEWRYRIGSQFLYALFSTDDFSGGTRRPRRQKTVDTRSRYQRAIDKSSERRQKNYRRNEQSGEYEYYEEKNFLHRLVLNLLSLIVAGAQCALSLFALSLIIFAEKSAMPPVLSVVVGLLALGGVLLLTLLDGLIRGGFNRLTFFVAFAVSPVRVAFQAITLVGVLVTLFTRHKRFADMQYPDRYPVTCIVFALTSICYLTPADKARKPEDDKRAREAFRAKLDAADARRKERAEEARRRAEAERERKKNLPHDTDRRGFCQTQFFPSGYSTSLGGGRRGFRITYQHACIEWGTPTVKVTVYAPFDAEDVRRSSCSDASSYRDVIVHQAERWVEREFKNHYSNYTYYYNSCVPIEDVRLIVTVST